MGFPKTVPLHFQTIKDRNSKKIRQNQEKNQKFMNHTKISILFILLHLSPVMVKAQNWNPYVSQAEAIPDPMIPVEFDGEGLLSFRLGNSGDDAMSVVRNQELTLTLTLSDGVPNDSVAHKAIGGTWAQKFDWKYLENYNTFIGTQVDEIPGNSEGTINLKYKPTNNSVKETPSNGLNINLQPPPYANGVNLTNDDQASFYTYVQAKDYSDAPASYGTAVHHINTFKDRRTKQYENYLYLGSLVDPESMELTSLDAHGDDNDLLDDEDGIVFPELVRGDSVILPVAVTVHDFGTGMLNAWFDWNGDGDFDDNNERLTSPKNIYKTDTIELDLLIPANAVVDRPTFCRFRLGDRRVMHPNILSLYGEVEDYKIQIVKNRSLNTEKLILDNEDNDKSGSLSENDVLTFKIIVTNMRDKEIHNLTINDNRLSPGNTACAALLPGESCILTGKYRITKEDINMGRIESQTVADADETDPVFSNDPLFLIKRSNEQ